MNYTAPSPHRAGFTLWEVTISLAMVAALSLAMYSSLSIAYKARRSAERTITPARTAAIIADVVGRDLENIQPLSDSDDYPQRFYGMPAGVSGTVSDALEFYAVVSATDHQSPGGAGMGAPFAEGLAKVQLYVRDDVTPPVLVRGVTRNLFGTIEPAVEEEVLCAGVTAFTIRYYDGYSWYDEWDTDAAEFESILPQAVQIDLAVQAPDGMVSRVTKLIPVATAEAPSYDTTLMSF